MVIGKAIVTILAELLIQELERRADGKRYEYQIRVLLIWVRRATLS